MSNLESGTAMSTIFCYDGQHKSVISWMGELGIPITSRSPHSVSEYTMDRMQGINDIVFITIPNHPASVPGELMAALRHHGATIIRIDDQYTRDRFSKASRR